MKTYHIISREDGKWAVIRKGAKRAASLHTNRMDALAEQKRLEIEGLSIAVTPLLEKNSKPSALAARLSERLKRARLMRGLTLRDLAEKLDFTVSHTTLQKYENGLSLPDSEILGRLAMALNLRPDYFLKKNTLVLKGVEYRKQTTLGKKRQVQLEEEAFEFFERYLEIENILGLTRPKLRLIDLTKETKATISMQIEKAAEKLREEWKLGLNPISNVHAMLEENGVKVKLLPAQNGFDGFSAFATTKDEDVPTITLSKGFLSDLPRLRFTALHELGHLVLKLPAGLEAREIESFCHRFASAFLIPEDSFRKIFGANRVQISVQELVMMKKEWGISFAATMRRARDLGIITQGRYKSFQFFRNSKGWRREEPSEWLGDEQSDRFDQLVLRALAEKSITMSKASSLLGISHNELAERFELVG